ncbi:sensor domain-containing diguanylate cyclase [Deinococcus yavapaiensis]|uniref:Diguanylate cyclase (GGDEF)-like protein n=1 Tax=Deinococcus yavapaiensis KR-236 TaxID=694435 RepID=A0A318RZW0_9DEIO|nr:sensor domain-containing diguanylate cyclase [Deinococcus yavapaiensis]PYE49944.1 diguanylate cyclase (GGDEF)-like protein [Deinococcus yavapaiensis KR-236]
MNEPIGYEQRRLEALARYAILDTLPEDAFDRLAKLAAAVFGAPIALVNFVADQYTFSKACYGIDVSHHDRSLSLCARTIESNAVLTVLDLSSDPHFAAFPTVTQTKGVRFYSGAPIKTHDGFNIGVICVLDYAPRGSVSDVERESLEHLAAIAFDELELRRKTLELQREASAKEALVRTLRSTQLMSDTLLGITSLAQLELPPAELASHALELLSRAIDVEWCNLSASRDDSVTFETIWARDDAADALTHAIPTRRGETGGASWRAANDSRPSFTSAYEQERGALPELVEAGLQAVAWLPLGEFDGAHYVLVLGRLREARRWTERDRQLLATATRAIRYALGVREQTRAARAASRTDLLTGLANRRALDEALEQVAERALPIVVAMLDVDGLKCVNDTRGHAAGDALLRIFGSTLAAHLPVGVSAFRLGGDEFALLLPLGEEDGPSGARARVLASIDPAVATARTAGFPEAGVSFGVACWPRDAETLEDVLERADAALYEDKRARKAFHANRDGERSVEGASNATNGAPLGDLVLDVEAATLLGSSPSALPSPKEAD